VAGGGAGRAGGAVGGRGPWEAIPRLARLSLVATFQHKAYAARRRSLPQHARSGAGSSNAAPRPTPPRTPSWPFVKDQARSRSAKQGVKYIIFLASTCGAGGWPSKRGDGGQVFLE
jgi:hypothetical protein